jgi:hypothetical protein
MQYIAFSSDKSAVGRHYILTRFSLPQYYTKLFTKEKSSVIPQAGVPACGGAVSDS